MNKPYQSIALELYTKLPYKIEGNIWIKIMKEVKKKEIYYISNTPSIFFKYPKNIFLHINKRSYNIYLLKKIFKKMRNKLLKKKNFSYLSHDFGIYLPTRDYVDIFPSLSYEYILYDIKQELLKKINHCQGPRNTFNYSQSNKQFMISDTKYNSTSYNKIYNTIYFIMNKFPLYKTKKYLDLNFNTLIQTWIKNFNLEKKLINNNKPYQSIVLELYTKLPY